MFSVLCCDHDKPVAFAPFDHLVACLSCAVCDVWVVFADELDGKDVSGPDSFYKVYEPVFERNKRFAVILPAPSLGDDDTPIDEVRKEAQARVFTTYARRVSKLRWAFPWPCLVLSVACVVAPPRRY